MTKEEFVSRLLLFGFDRAKFNDRRYYYAVAARRHGGLLIIVDTGDEPSDDSVSLSLQGRSARPSGPLYAKNTSFSNALEIIASGLDSSYD